MALTSPALTEPMSMSIMESDDEEARLDAQKAQLEESIATLRKRKDLLATTLLSSPKTLAALEHPDTSTTGPHPSPRDLDRARALLRSHIAAQEKRTHRLVAGCTLFEVRDPDPAAVGEKPLLGVQFDAIDEEGRAMRPDYVIFRRSETPPQLRVFLSTLPPAVDVAGLAGRWLGGAEDVPLEKGLVMFVKRVRQALVGWRLDEAAQRIQGTS